MLLGLNGFSQKVFLFRIKLVWIEKERYSHKTYNAIFIKEIITLYVACLKKIILQKDKYKVNMKVNIKIGAKIKVTKRPNVQFLIQGIIKQRISKFR